MSLATQRAYRRRVARMVLGFVVMCSAIAIGIAAAWGHEEFRCTSASYRNATGMDCCSASTDCVRVPNETAYEARIGSEITATFRRVETPWAVYPAETRNVTISAVHPSCDDHGWSWVCKPGCLFRSTGM